jgi:uncharacterized protein YgbK (DUF1537 family)
VSREQVRTFGGVWTVLQSPDEREPDVSAPAYHLAKKAAAVLRAERPDAVVIIGGDTAQAILDQLKIVELRPLGELFPGVPASEVLLDDRPLIVISKAGGFGTPDVLLRVREALKG